MPNYYVPGSEEYYSRFIQSPPSNDGGVPRFTNDPKFQEIARKALVDNFNGPMPVGGAQTVVPGGVYRTNKDGITFFPQEAITNTPLKKETKPRNTYTTVTNDPYAGYRGQLDDLYNKVMGVDGYKAGTYTPGQYTAKYDTTGLQQQLQGYADAVTNYGDFSYDTNADALYQQALENYMMMGNQAMVDATANAASLTGGYGNSYASQVGNQAYQQYITQAHNALPQYQQMAMDVWSAGLDKRLNQYNMGLQQLSNLMALEDQNFNQWLANEDALYKAFNVNEQNAFNEWLAGYNQANDQYNLGLNHANTMVSWQPQTVYSGGNSAPKQTTTTQAATGNQVVLPNGKVVNTTPAVTNPYTSAQLEELLKLQNKK